MRTELHVRLDGPVGWLRLRAEGDALTAVDFVDRAPREHEVSGPDVLPVLERAVAGLAAFVRRGGPIREIPVAPDGTPFQQRVWQRMRRIPAGRTMTYGDLARELGTGPRAVAGACRRNPIPLFIPCHRVVSGRGLGGYAGAVDGRPLERKRWLLTLEGALRDGSARARP